MPLTIFVAHENMGLTRRAYILLVHHPYILTTITKISETFGQNKPKFYVEPVRIEEINVCLPKLARLQNAQKLFQNQLADSGNLYQLNSVMRKPDICLCENKGADQLCSNCEADRRLCFLLLG